MDAKRRLEPHSRLTRMCAAMTTAMVDHPEYVEGDDRCIVFLDSDVEGEGGLVMYGYRDDGGELDETAALSAIFSHLRAIFETHGLAMELPVIHRMGPLN